MFSSRTEWNLDANRLTLLHREMLLKGEAICDLTVSNPTTCGLGPPPGFTERLADPRVLSYAPDPKGLPIARQAVSRYYSKQGAVVDPKSVILTSSTSEAYSFVFTLLCDPGEHILVPRPGYPLFETLAGLQGIQIRRYDLQYDGEWHVDLDSLDRALSPKAKAILLLHPSNPAGSFVKNDEWEFIAGAAARHGIPLIVDEVFLPFPLDSGKEIARTFAGRQEVPSIILNGLSKLAGLPQLKIAWMCVAGPDPWHTGSLSRLEVLADAFLSVSTASQVLLPGILDTIESFSDPIHLRTKENFSYLRSLSLGGCTVLRCEGGWNAMIRLPATRSDEEWALMFLREGKVLVHPGFLFDAVAGTYCVVSLLAAPGTFRTGMQRIAEFFNSPVSR